MSTTVDSPSSTRARPAAGAPTYLSGWGGTPRSVANLRRVTAETELPAVLAAPDRRGVLARGLGSSYGDAAQNSGGIVLDMTTLAGLNLQRLGAGVVIAQGGASLDSIMRACVPCGWFVAVSPGTRRVTVGGAIAADVHGKGHHRDGSFGRHVEWIRLLTPRGELTVGPGDPVFEATVGGMGLTGVIVEAAIRMVAIETNEVLVDTDRCADLEQLLERMEREDDRYAFSVAWVDCLARGRRLGRGVLERANFAPAVPSPTAAGFPDERRLDFDPQARMRVPFPAPSRLIGHPAIAAFNELWFRHAPACERARARHLATFFHPLDTIRDWNLLYGRRGFLQYQFAVPPQASGTLRVALEQLIAARAPISLAVLKRFGPASGAPLSFPIPGWTLAIDLPAVPWVRPVLDQLDATVAAAGGRVYLAKDARLRPELLGEMYPRLEEWRASRRLADPDGVLRSDLARRLALTGTGR